MASFSGRSRGEESQKRMQMESFITNTPIIRYIVPTVFSLESFQPDTSGRGLLVAT